MVLQMMCPSCATTNWSRYGNEGLFECGNCKERHIISEMVVVGEYYVYRFVNDSWGGIPFYVGKGKESRFKQIQGRNRHILSICKNTQWHPEIIRYCSSEKEALEQEIIIKKIYKDNGYPIIDGETSKVHLLQQREGIERAKRNGKYKGGKRKEIPNFAEHYTRYKSREITKTALAKELNISRPTLDKLIKEYEESSVVLGNDDI